MVLHSSGEGQHDAVCYLLDEMPLPAGPLELFSEAAASPIARHLQRRARRVRVVGWGRSWPRIFGKGSSDLTAAVKSEDLLPESAHRPWLRRRSTGDRSICTMSSPVQCDAEDARGDVKEWMYTESGHLKAGTECWPSARSGVWRICHPGTPGDEVLCG
ncbi:Os06g0658600 [Oryza sativa Japonica Group]|uniref:Os06g0658600 protein n=1 Tax=Oryza sativa subsp. japonica TaxID=39947 RepID=A0A0P0WZK1_ORYSJ|nr:Os06g0658600 [Oryza sativa Japonica Group]